MQLDLLAWAAEAELRRLQRLHKAHPKIWAKRLRAEMARLLKGE